MSPAVRADLPIHPEAVDGDPTRTRWRVPAGVPAFHGPVASAPGPLGALLDDGTLRSVVLEPGAVLIEAGPGQAWNRIGGQVRTALLQALTRPAHTWTPADPQGDALPPSDAQPPDVVLAGHARRLLDGPIGDTVRSHGGRAELVEARDGVVLLRVAGACAGCPAQRTTFTDGFERELRACCPDLVGVRVVEEAGRGLREIMPRLVRRRPR